jgi:hypothetical protein
MEINELKRPELRKQMISIRTFPSYSKWLKEKDISPSAMFNKCVEELIRKDKQLKFLQE